MAGPNDNDNDDSLGFGTSWVTEEEFWNDVDESRREVQWAPHKCQHKWKATFGLFRVWEDCTKCGARREDVEEANAAD